MDPLLPESLARAIGWVFQLDRPRRRYGHSPTHALWPPVAGRRGAMTQKGKGTRERRVLGTQGASVSKRGSSSRSPNSRKDSLASQSPEPSSGTTNGSSSTKPLNEPLAKESVDSSTTRPASPRGKSPPSRSSKSESPEIRRSPEAQNAGGATYVERGEHADRNKPEYASWSDMEIELYNNQQDLGLEPLLPASWRLDFPTIPSVVFESEDEDAYIDTHSGNRLAAIHALKTLMEIGKRVREKNFQKMHTSEILRRAVGSYAKWAMEDADLQNRDFIPILTVKCSKRGEGYRKCLDRTKKEMHRLASLHRDRWEAAKDEAGTANPELLPQPPPTIFGIMIVQTTLLIASLANSDDESQIRISIVLEYHEEGQDIWNVLTVGTFLMMIRNYLLTLKAEKLHEESAEDPDA